MHNGGWEALLRHIPTEQQSKYMLVTVSGTEIAISGFLRIEKELVIVKGRLSGSQEQGRIFFVPYSQIDYFGTSQITKDSEFAEVFDSFHFPEPVSAAAPNYAAAPPPSEPEPAPSAKPSSFIGPTPPASTASGIRRIVRSQVLEKFRSMRSNGPPSSSDLPRPPQP